MPSLAFRTSNGTKEKLCSKCKEWLPFSEYHKNKSSKYGIGSYCKS